VSGTYVAVKLVKSTENSIRGLCRAVTKLDTDLHCTVIYSTSVIDDVEEHLNPSRVYNGFIKSVNWWAGHNGAGYIVAQIFCPLLESRNQFWVGKGGSNSAKYEGIKLHITLQTGISKARAEKAIISELQEALLGLRVSLTNEFAEKLKAL
jgi:hypothetical protein